MGSLTPPTSPPTVWDQTGCVLANGPVSSGLWRLDLGLPRPIDFAPGQFAMLNLRGRARLVFRRPFSILDAGDRGLSFLYRVVGEGTGLLAGLGPGEELDCLAPLGRPFPEPTPATPPVLLLAGGVGLPPLHAWLARHGRDHDLACFGGRDGGDVPWPLLPEPWQVSVDCAEGLPAGTSAHLGLVTALAERLLEAAPAKGPRQVLACGPLPLLRAAARLARDRGWPCLVSVEEHMGCGYGVCKGCVVPLRAPAEPGWRHANACSEGPVFAAEDLDWDRFGARHGGSA